MLKNLIRIKRTRFKFHFRPISTVAVALSGGVDSTVAAYLLKKQGHNVIGLHMRNWSETEEKGYCPGEEDQRQVEQVAKLLSIPLNVVHFEEDYWNTVFAPMIKSYETGTLTPNPDVACNREIKFKCLLDKSQELGADLLATGHYARIIPDENNQPQLAQAIDPHKDQSFFLMQLTAPILKQILFPIGHLHKTEVKALAKEAGLPNHDRKESMGICFIGKRKFGQFLSEYVQSEPGDFIDLEGKKVGTHNGLAFYTIGQGAKIGGAPTKMFVVDKDPIKKTITVCSDTHHPSLFSNYLTADICWIQGQPPKELAEGGFMDCRFKMRHPGIPLKGRICAKAPHYQVNFDVPQRAVSLGQMVGIYHDSYDAVCLGGGSIVGKG